MKYIIDNDNDLVFDRVADIVDWLTDSLDEDGYDEWLDELYPDTEICGISYSASIALKRVDPVAYDCGFYDYQEHVRSYLTDDIGYMCDGDSYEFSLYTIRAIAD